MDAKEEALVAKEEEKVPSKKVEQVVKPFAEVTGQAVKPLDQIRQQAMTAYAAYLEAEEQVA